MSRYNYKCAECADTGFIRYSDGMNTRAEYCPRCNPPQNQIDPRLPTKDPLEESYQGRFNLDDAETFARLVRAAEPFTHGLIDWEVNHGPREDGEQFIAILPVKMFRELINAIEKARGN
jgi:hypothetical protein